MSSAWCHCAAARARRSHRGDEGGDDQLLPRTLAGRTRRVRDPRQGADPRHVREPSGIRETEPDDAGGSPRAQARYIPVEADGHGQGGRRHRLLPVPDRYGLSDRHLHPDRRLARWPASRLPARRQGRGSALLNIVQTGIWKPWPFSRNARRVPRILLRHLAWRPRRRPGWRGGPGGRWRSAPRRGRRSSGRSVRRRRTR